jgi:hypothetical protein
MKWNHTTESPLVDAWLMQQAERFGDRLQPVVNELLLAVAEGRLVDPAPLAAQVAELERQNAQLYTLLQQAVGATRAGDAPPAAPPAQAAGSRGLNFTK